MHRSSTEGASLPVVLHQDPWIIAVSKPAGMPVQSDPTGDPDLITVLRNGLQDPQIELVHRIDRPVSGVVLLARTAEALPALHSLFSARSVQKRYWAIVEGSVPAMSAPLRLEHALEHDVRTRKARVVVADHRALACTTVRLLACGDRYTLVEAVPEGGAFHQIRAQLAAWGHPIKGDVKYGARRGEKDRSIALHARSLTFKHPFTGQAVVIEAPAPQDRIWVVLTAGMVG